MKKKPTVTDSTKKSVNISIIPQALKPGANSFHYFSYSEKIRLGIKYDYQKTLDRWSKMSDVQKNGYKQQASSLPKHKKTIGASRAVSAYDVLRRVLKKHDFQPNDDSSMNWNEYAVEIRQWIDMRYPSEWKNWLTMPENKQLIMIRRADLDLASH